MLLSFAMSSWTTIDDTLAAVAQVEADAKSHPPTPRTTVTRAEIERQVVSGEIHVDPFVEYEAWGKLPWETDRQYEYFCHYRDMGLTRTRNAVASHFGVTPARIHKIAKEREWEERALQWDRHLEKIFQLEVAENTREMARRHASIAKNGVAALAMAFTPLLEELEEDEEAFKERFLSQNIKAQMNQVVAAARAIPGIMNAERLSMGMPTEIAESHHTSEATVMIQSRDDLAEVLSLISGVGAIQASGTSTGGDSEPEKEADSQAE